MAAPRPLILALAAVVVPPAVAPPLALLIAVLGIDMNGGVALGLTGLSVVAGAGLAVLLHRHLPSPGPGASDRTLAGTTPVVLAGIITMLVWTWSRPVLDWDGLYYHVPAVQGWWHAGGVRWIENTADLPFVNGYPMALEVLGYLGVHLFGHDRWLDAWNVILWPAAAVGLATTARLWGARPAWAALAGLSFLLVPGWMLGSQVAYVDAGFASAMAAFVAATVWRLQRNDHVASALLWGAAGGLAAGTKGTGILLAGLATGLLVIDLFRRPPAQRASATRALLIGGLLLVAIGGVWPVRALVHTGNPIHPVQLVIGAKVVAPGVDAHAAADLSLPDSLAELPEPIRPIAVWARPFTPIVSYDQPEGLGPMWTLGAVPGLLFLLWTGRRRLDVVGPIALLVLGLLVQPAPWWSRLTLWIAAFGLPAFAVMGSRLTEANVSVARRRAARLAVVLVMVAAAWSTADAARRTVAKPIGTDAIAHYFPALREHPDWTDFASAPRIARSDWGRLGTLMGGALASPIGARDVIRVDGPATIPADVDWWIWDVSGTRTPPDDLPGWRVTDAPRAGFVLLQRNPHRETSTETP